jgi:hypothetical protein
MTYRFLPAAAAMLFVTGAALAQMPPANDHPGKAGTQNHFTEMCRDRPAQAAGELAALEIRLQLTEKQKPLFERWKKVRMTTAKSADCAPPPDGEPSIIDSLKHEEKMLRQRLDELKAEQPALEALVASLTDQQKQAFAPPRHRHGPGRPEPMDRPDGQNRGAPPPPPEN